MAFSYALPAFPCSVSSLDLRLERFFSHRFRLQKRERLADSEMRATMTIVQTTLFIFAHELATVHFLTHATGMKSVSFFNAERLTRSARASGRASSFSGHSLPAHTLNRGNDSSHARMSPGK